MTRRHIGGAAFVAKKGREGNLRRAIQRARPFSDTIEWCGCFTPSEIVELVAAGAGDCVKACPRDDPKRIKLHFESEIKWAQERVEKGDAMRTWFYFIPNPELLHLLRKAHP